MHSFSDLFMHFLKDMYYAEQQTRKSLPLFIAAVQNTSAKALLASYEKATKTNIERLAAVFRAIGQEPEGATCEAILGLLKETEDLLQASSGAGPIQDAGVVACVQAVQHYAIARYGALLAWGRHWDNQEAADYMRQILDSVRDSATTLDQLAGLELAKSAHAAT